MGAGDRGGTIRDDDGDRSRRQDPLSTGAGSVAEGAGEVTSIYAAGPTR